MRFAPVVGSRREGAGESRRCLAVAAPIEAKQVLRLFCQMVKVGTVGQRLHERPPCIGLPKTRNTGSTKALQSTALTRLAICWPDT
jgi:hypothetical protein